VGRIGVEQCGQNVNVDFTVAPHPLQIMGIGSRSKKYKMIPMALGMKIASNVHMTDRMPRRLASPLT
jgi:hypothetical protein